MCRVQLLRIHSPRANIIFHHFEGLAPVILLLFVSHVPGDGSRQLFLQLPSRCVGRASDLGLANQIYILDTVSNVADLRPSRLLRLREIGVVEWEAVQLDRVGRQQSLARLGRASLAHPLAQA